MPRLLLAVFVPLAHVFDALRFALSRPKPKAGPRLYLVISEELEEFEHDVERACGGGQ